MKDKTQLPPDEQPAKKPFKVRILDGNKNSSLKALVMVGGVGPRKEDQPRDAALGVPPSDRVAPWLTEAMRDPMFAARWADESDESFRPFAVAVFELRNASLLPQGSRAALFRELCVRQRGELLSELLGKPIAPMVIKALSRSQWQDFARDDWEFFFSMIPGQGDTSALGHVRRITPILVRQFAWVPNELRVAAVLNVISALEVPAARWKQLGHFLEQADAGRRAEFLRTAGSVASNGDFWDFYFRCEGKYWRPFDLPQSANTSELLEPLASPLDMQAEGLRMRNCLASRVSRVLDGSRIYFRLRGDPPVDAELVRQGDRMIPGAVLGFENAPVPLALVESIRTELQRLAEWISTTGESVSTKAQGAYVEALRARARESFGAGDIAELIGSLQSSVGKSRSWTDGAFAIFELERGGFVQFMSSPDGTEYLCEISSHKYNDAVDRTLTAEVVDLIEKAGFVWPNGTNNFLRWFNVSSEEDIRALAELALAVLSSIFGHRQGQNLTVKTHVPT